MEENRIETIIREIEKIIGPCDYEENLSDDDDIEIIPCNYSDVGIEIAEDSIISIFASFPYYDYSEKDLVEGQCDIEDWEADVHTALLENSFKLFLKDHSLCYTVSEWDDGHYMCPEFVARVGFSCVEYSDSVVKEFVRIYDQFVSTFEHYDDKSFRRYIVKTILRQHGIIATEDASVHFCDASIQIVEERLTPESNIDHYYFGNEKFLFSSNGEQYAADIKPLKAFYEIASMCELSDNISLCFEHLPLFDSNTLYAHTAHLIFTLRAFRNEQQIYSSVEETSAILSLRPLLPFASDKFKDSFYLSFSEIFDSFSGQEPLIITEGSTDWKHIKKYWDAFGYPEMKVQFLEYEPLNSKKDAETKLEMGSSALLEMCKSLSKIGIGKTVIFIADRDEPKIIKEMGANNSYKNWGNNVFSFVLPIPDHRSSTPDICIEHYYSDTDIQTYYPCSDGIERRLFLGRDFDKYGRNIQNGLLCIKRNLCGKDSMKVIDGTSESKVVSFSESSEINYALSKQEFAEKSSIKKDSPAYYAFEKLASVITQIIKSAKA